MSTTLTPTGSLRELMDALVIVEQGIHDDLAVYRWQPLGIPELPALWNWMSPSTFEIRDQMRWRDTVTITVRIGLAHTDVDADMEMIEIYADAFRDAIDDALYNGRPLGGTVTWAERAGMNMAAFEFNQIAVLGIEFPLNFRLDRHITPNF